MEQQAPKMLSAREVCNRLVISDTALGDMIRRGDFPRGIKITKDRQWFEMDVIAVLHLRGRGMLAEGQSKPPPTPAQEQVDPDVG